MQRVYTYSMQCATADSENAMQGNGTNCSKRNGCAMVHPKVQCARLVVCVYGNDQLTPGNQWLAIESVTLGEDASPPLSPPKNRLAITRSNRVNRGIAYQ